VSDPSPLRQPGDTRLLRRVRWRLLAWSAGTTFILLVALGAALYASVSASLAASGTSQLQQRADGLANVVSGLLALPPVGSGDTPFGRPVFGGPASGTLAIVVGQDGTPIGPLPPELKGLPLASGVDGALKNGSDLMTTTLNETPVRVLSESTLVDGETYVIQVIQDRSAEQRTLEALLRVLLVGGLATLALAAAFGYLYAGRALVPIRESLRRQREFVADASHELRTPLTVLRASVEDLRRHPHESVADVGDALDDMEAEVDHLSTLVDDLHTLALSDAGALTYRMEEVNVCDVVQLALDAFRERIAERRLSVEADTKGNFGALVRGDPDRLAQLFRNIVENSVRYTDAGGTLRVECGVRDASAHIEILDSAPGVPDEVLPRLFERFYRPEGSRSRASGGAGLGLAICKNIVEAHAGQIAARPSRLGGVCIEVDLPLVAA